jgi:hypothetical protein
MPYYFSRPYFGWLITEITTTKISILYSQPIYALVHPLTTMQAIANYPKHYSRIDLKAEACYKMYMVTINIWFQ